MSISANVVTSDECISCHRPLPPGLFCPYCGVFAGDPQGTVVMASRLSRLGAWFVNGLLLFFTLFIGWVIWWFIVAPRGQNPGKAVVGLRVMRTDGRAATTGYMFVRGLAGIVLGFVPLYLDELWLLWDRDAQTLHDKLVGTVVVRAQGSERLVTEGSLGPLRPGVTPPPAFAPPVTLPGTASTGAPAAAPQAPGAGGSQDVMSQLERLTALHQSGALTDEEFAAKKAELLSRL